MVHQSESSDCSEQLESIGQIKDIVILKDDEQGNFKSFLKIQF